jgi:hypothetical protein
MPSANFNDRYSQGRRGMIRVMPKFSIKDLLVAVLLVSGGLAMCIAATTFDRRSLDSFPVIVPLYFAGSAAVGAGTFYCFLPWPIGATVGFVGGLLLSALFV